MVDAGDGEAEAVGEILLAVHVDLLHAAGVVDQRGAAVGRHDPLGLGLEQDAVALGDGLVAGEADDLGLARHLGRDEEDALEQRDGAGRAEEKITGPDSRDGKGDEQAAVHAAGGHDVAEVHRGGAQVGVLLDGLHQLGRIAGVAGLTQLHRGYDAPAQLGIVPLDQQRAGFDLGRLGEEGHQVPAGVMDQQRDVRREEQEADEDVQVHHPVEEHLQRDQHDGERGDARDLFRDVDRAMPPAQVHELGRQPLRHRALPRDHGRLVERNLDGRHRHALLRLLFSRKDFFGDEVEDGHGAGGFNAKGSLELPAFAQEPFQRSDENHEGVIERRESQFNFLR